MHEGVEALVGIFMAFVGEVYIDHGGCELCMPQGALDETGVHASFEQRGGVGVVFQKWRWPLLYYPSKGISVDKQANDDVVHLYRFREADGLTD